MQRDREMLERIISKSIPEPNSGCWLWTGAVTSCGYGSFAFRGARNIPAHRAAYASVNGPVPPGLFVCHSCDVSLCVNPDHLWAGTATDNVRDMMRKGRAVFKGGKSFGSSNPRAKLTERDVYAIRYESRESDKECALQYGVTIKLVRLIRADRIWPHVTQNHSETPRPDTAAAGDEVDGRAERPSFPSSASIREAA